MKKAIIFASALMTLSACEMKDELWSTSNTDHSLQGTMALNISATEPESMTRATAVSVADFPVTITGKDAVADVAYSFASVSTLPNSIQMPVGTYTVNAHTPGDIQRQMATPYYGGSKDFSVIYGVQTKVDLVCKMMNSRIVVNLDDDFKAKYTAWTITINDGTDQALAYTETSSYEPIFWYFMNETTEITVDIRATTVEGNSVYASNTYTKRSCNEGYMDIENDNFTGGDAITVNFTPAEDPDGTITGISISTNITFENYDETITIEAKDKGADDVIDDPDPNDPSNPGDPSVSEAEIEVTFAYGQNFTVNYMQDSGYPAVQVDFTFPTGLKNLYVKVAGSADFEFACGLMGLTDGDGLDLASDAALELKDLFSLPKVGDKTYRFSLNETLWGLLTCAPGYPGKQTFTLKAVDKNGKTADGSLTIQIN